MEIRKALGRLLMHVAGKLAPVEPPVPIPVPVPSTRSRASGRSELSEFEERLRVALRLTGTVAAGHVRFLGLSEVRAALGPRWERLAGSVETIARGIIERRLADFEVYSQVGELQYVMVFPTLDEAAARTKCQVIADEIKRRLLGENFGEGKMEVSAAATTMDHRMAEEPALMATLCDRLDDEAKQRPRGGVAAASPYSFGEEDAGEPRPPVDEFPFGTARVRVRPPEPGEPGSEHLYRPIWDLRKNVVSTYLYVPEPVAAPPAEPGRPDAATEEPVERDLLALRAVVQDLSEILKAERKLLLAVPVHYPTLASGNHRREYLRLCRTMPKARGNLVIFEMIDVPPGIPQTRLVELVGMLKPFARAILLQLPLHTKLFRPAAEARVFAVGVDISSDPASEAETIAAMQRFARAAVAARLRCYAHGVRTVSLASAAVGAGFDYVDGDSVTSLTEAPDRIYRFSIRDLYRRLGGEAR